MLTGRLQVLAASGRRFEIEAWACIAITVGV